MNSVAAEECVRQVIADTWPILLDFDGPVTPLYVGGRNLRLADRMRAALIAADIRLPQDISTTLDPLAVLRWSAVNVPPAAARAVERICTAGEIQFATEAAPTPGAHELLLACHQVGRPVVIVSNNAPEPIHTYLDRYQLDHLVRAVVGRTHGHPERMKPHPAAVLRALDVLKEQAPACSLIGDSVSDIEVAHLTGVRSIGFAKNPRRGVELEMAGANAIVDDLSRLARHIALRSKPNLVD